jgi:NADH-quinone oxidoreductase subunit L
MFGAAEHHGEARTEIMVTLLTLAVIAAGIYWAYLKYGKAGAQIAEASENVFYRLSLNKYYIDELYDGFVVRPFTACSRFLAQIVDLWVIDGTVNGIAALARGLGWVTRGLQTGNVQHYLAGFLLGTLALVAYYIGQL